jgi:hypothetical protein
MNPYKNLFLQNTIVKNINDMEDELVTYFKSLSRNILKDVYEMDYHINILHIILIYSKPLYLKMI